MSKQSPVLFLVFIYIFCGLLLIYFETLIKNRYSNEEQTTPLEDYDDDDEESKKRKVFHILTLPAAVFTFQRVRKERRSKKNQRQTINS